jgi:hypothetical protein
MFRSPRDHHQGIISKQRRTKPTTVWLFYIFIFYANFVDIVLRFFDIIPWWWSLGNRNKYECLKWYCNIKYLGKGSCILLFECCELEVWSKLHVSSADQLFTDGDKGDGIVFTGICIFVRNITLWKYQHLLVQFEKFGNENSNSMQNLYGITYILL